MRSLTRKWKRPQAALTDLQSTRFGWEGDDEDEKGKTRIASRWLTCSGGGMPEMRPLAKWTCGGDGAWRGAGAAEVQRGGRWCVSVRPCEREMLWGETGQQVGGGPREFKRARQAEPVESLVICWAYKDFTGPSCSLLGLLCKAGL